jgi:hypothetical protein
MKFLRRLHLYLGCFFAPMLLFYVATGWYQTVTIDRRKGLGEAETWVDRMRSVHVDQIYPADSAMGYSPKLFQLLVVLMSVALLVTIVLGVILAFRSIRQRWLVWLSLGLGIAVPALLLWLGQAH